MFRDGGFIVGFDSEKGSIAEPMIDLIEEAAIPIAMVGLLYALPNTQLTRRLAREGRLYVDHDSAPANKGDQCTAGVNYETKRFAARNFAGFIARSSRGSTIPTSSAAVWSGSLRCWIARAGAKNCLRGMSGAG